MQDHAGTVIGGMTDVSRPYEPRSMRPEIVGSSSRQRSRTSDGSAQSSPMSMTFRGTRRSVAGGVGTVGPTPPRSARAVRHDVRVRGTSASMRAPERRSRGT